MIRRLSSARCTERRAAMEWLDIKSHAGAERATKNDYRGRGNLRVLPKRGR
ncbi:MAG: hypothetical protein MZV64_71630 [Ignavibacteriales bacterium]|nr:hypothetical protein [Ignavibacteriales bacterium]